MSDPSGTLGTVVTTERKTEDDGTPITDVHVDAGAGDMLDAELYQPPGEDSLPLPGDGALLQEAPGTGAKAAVGFHDPKNQGKAGEGEKRQYSRQTDGTLAAEIWLKSGALHIEIAPGMTFPIYIKTGGRVVIDSPDIRVGSEEASRPIACVGDMVSGSVAALSAAAGFPIVPPPPALPTPSGGVPFVGKIISGSARAKAT